MFSYVNGKRNVYFFLFIFNDYCIYILYKVKLMFIFLINKLKVVLIWVNMLLNVIKSIWLVDIFGVLLIELFFGWINLLY